MSKELKLAFLRTFIIISLLGLMIFMLTDCSSVISIQTGTGNTKTISQDTKWDEPITLDADVEAFSKNIDTVQPDSLN